MAVTRRGSEDDIQLHFMLYIKRLIPLNLFLFINIIVCMCHMILFLHQREQTALSCDNHLWCILYYYIIFRGWGERHLWESNGIWMCCECCFKWSTSCKPIVKFLGILYSLFGFVYRYQYFISLTIRAFIYFLYNNILSASS